VAVNDAIGGPRARVSLCLHVVNPPISCPSSGILLVLAHCCHDLYLFEPRERCLTHGESMFHKRLQMRFIWTYSVCRLDDAAKRQHTTKREVLIRRTSVIAYLPEFLQVSIIKTLSAAHFSSCFKPPVFARYQSSDRSYTQRHAFRSVCYHHQRCIAAYSHSPECHASANDIASMCCTLAPQNVGGPKY